MYAKGAWDPVRQDDWKAGEDGVCERLAEVGGVAAGRAEGARSGKEGGPTKGGGDGGSSMGEVAGRGEAQSSGDAGRGEVGAGDDGIIMEQVEREGGGGTAHADGWMEGRAVEAEAGGGKGVDGVG